MDKALLQKQRYLEDIKRVLEGKIVKLDTNKLDLPKLEQEDE